MVKAIDIHKLTLEELSGVVGLYPWYAGARMELCRRMSEMGALSEVQIAETALHLERRRTLAALRQEDRSTDCSDKDARRIMASFMPEAEPEQAERRVYAVGGDFFSQDQYAGASREGDGIFSHFGAKAREEGWLPEPEVGGDATDFCTETLAAIYLEQGYPKEAVDIYSRLSLRYPEKSVYFAALIDEINKKDN